MAFCRGPLFWFPGVDDSLGIMAANRQLEDLCALYEQKSEPELLALYAQRDDLTDLAQQALEQVMRQRHIAAPTAAAEEASSAPDAEQPRGLAADEVCLFTFSDAFQASEALRLLEQHDVPCRMVNWDELRPRSESGGPPMRLGLVVSRPDAEQAKRILQKAMNLFPPAEGHDDFADFDALDGFLLVGVFARQDALRVAHALGFHGVSYLWSDDREDPAAETDDVQIQVHGTRLDHAQQIAEAALGESE